MISDPRFAPRRNDLPWLRRRARPAAAAPDSEVANFIAGRSDHPRHHTNAAPEQSVPVQSAPGQSVPVAAAPAPPAPAPPAPAPPVQSRAASASLDLDEPATRSQPPATTSSAAPERPARVAGKPARPAKRRRDVRVPAHGRVILTPTAPTVTLSPIQSGVGSLRIEAACSADVGDLRLGAAYELADGTCSTVQMTQGERFAPPHSRRPVLIGSRDGFETISIDLRQVRSLRRLIVYAFSENRQPLAWGGTLVTTTYGGARIELPLETLQGGTVAVLQSVYVVRGECVLRAEMQALNGDVREAARAYGYDTITWLDDRTPVL